MEMVQLGPALACHLLSVTFPEMTMAGSQDRDWELEEEDAEDQSVKKTTTQTTLPLLVTSMKQSPSKLHP